VQTGILTCDILGHIEWSLIGFSTFLSGSLGMKNKIQRSVYTLTRTQL